MLAAIFEEFRQSLVVTQVPDPAPAPDSVVIEVKANGICRSDWHAWMGHDSSVSPPHVPGHEMAGVVAEVGRDVSTFKVGERVTVPFACGCGSCRYCSKGQLHICDRQFQPGFTHWGAFAEFVEIRFAKHNLVRIPDELDFVDTASLGCRFATAYRTVLQQGKVSEGTWLVVHGCGGLGLAAVQLGLSVGARVIAVDISPERLALANSMGHVSRINASVGNDVVERIFDITKGGADVSIDALGSRVTSINSVLCLRKQGRHIQAGLLLGDESEPALPLDRVISHELELIGSHGMSATCYPEMLDLIISRGIGLHRLVGRRIPLTAAGQALEEMTEFVADGITVIDDFKN